MAGMPGRWLKAKRMEEIEEKEEQTLAMLSERVSKGWTYGKVCEELGVGWTELLRWLQAKEERWGVYLKAHEARAWNYAHEAVEIADAAVDGPEGNVASSKLRIDTRLRLAKAYAPQTFGERGGIGISVGEVGGVEITWKGGGVGGGVEGTLRVEGGTKESSGSSGRVLENE